MLGLFLGRNLLKNFLNLEVMNLLNLEVMKLGGGCFVGCEVIVKRKLGRFRRMEKRKKEMVSVDGFVAAANLNLNLKRLAFEVSRILHCCCCC
ncbi:hypothetical protein L195_g032280 [Trifolium pratense]|uniref:Uncharacterized protein n=1 Tax=Trifolium pratense TaxID=57577 RepID=A0A2K3LCW0_TRIPR|nr:hypothetical protein L195_g032280 [Trifolium pratense]